MSFKVVTESSLVGHLILFKEEVAKELNLKAEDDSRDFDEYEASKVKYEIIEIQRGKACDIIVFIEYKLDDNPFNPQIHVRPFIRLKGARDFLISDIRKAKRIESAMRRIRYRLEKINAINQSSQKAKNRLRYISEAFNQLEGTPLSFILRPGLCGFTDSAENRQESSITETE